MEKPEADRLKEIVPTPPFLPGTVWLVGAGPGDPSLLTLAAWQALQRADIVVHDALVAGPVLDLIPAHISRESVGKRGGRPSPHQSEISARLINLARSGRRVLRLKGGDPFVFGRGGEECLALVAAGIPFRIVPGLTAGMAGPAWAGIPVTFGDQGYAVTFATGHDAAGATGRQDWDALARGAPVLVLYMAMRPLEEIARRLIEGGRPASEPVAVIAEATTPRQRTLVTTLGYCAADVAAAGLGAPAVVVVGPVAALHEKLRWWPENEGHGEVPPDEGRPPS